VRGTGQAGSVDPVPWGRRGGVIPVLWRPSLIWTKRRIGASEDHEGYVLEVEG
jgi:hypothetical protein